METLTFILGLIPVAMQVEGGIETLVHLVATLAAGGKLSDEDVARIKADANLADVEYDLALEAAKLRLKK